MKLPNILSKHLEYEGRIFNVENIKLQDETNKKYDRQIVTEKNSVLILPVMFVDNDVLFYLQDEYRSGINEITTGFPAGLIEKGEKPEEAMARELIEETGFTDFEIDVGSILNGNVSEGFTNEKSYFGYAEIKKPNKCKAQKLDKDEHITGGKWVRVHTLADFNKLLKSISSVSGKCALLQFLNETIVKKNFE